MTQNNNTLEIQDSESRMARVPGKLEIEYEWEKEEEKTTNKMKKLLEAFIE